MIYFIRDEASGHLKIGYAVDPWRRLSKIQSDTPARVDIVAIEDGGVDREAELHLQFSHARSRGEWFRPADDLVAYVALLGPPQKPSPNARSRAFWGGLSSAEVCRAVNISTPHASDILNGKRRPSPELAMELQRVTGRSAIEFVFGNMAPEALAIHGVAPLERAA